MFRTLALSLLLLSLAATSCRGHTGDPGATGPAGANGQAGADGADGANGKDGVDGVDGKDGTTGLAFDYVRGIDGVNILNGVLIIKASLVVPKTILAMAPDAAAPRKTISRKRVTVTDGVQLVIGMPKANVRYHLIPVPKGNVKVTSTFRPKDPESWSLPFGGVEYLAMIPMNSVTALALDPAIVAQGALIAFPKDGFRNLHLFKHSICIGKEVWIRW